MDLGELKKSILSNDIKPFYYLTGSDEFIKNMAVERIKTVVTDFKEMNISILSSPNPNEVIDLLTTIPFCSDYRVIILEDVKDYSPYIEYFNNPCESSVLVLREGGGADKKKSRKTESNKKALADSIIQKMPHVECEPLEGTQMLSFLAREAKIYNAQILEDAAKLLVEYCHSDMFRLQSEVRKLASLRSNDYITIDDVKELVKPDVEYSVWALGDEIANGNKSKALTMFNSLDDGRTDSRTLLFGVIYSHFRKIYYTAVTQSDELLISVLNMKPFVVSRTRTLVKKIGVESAKKIIEFLCDFDYRSKNGMIPESAYGEYLVIGIINALKGNAIEK